MSHFREGKSISTVPGYSIYTTQTTDPLNEIIIFPTCTQSILLTPSQMKTLVFRQKKKKKKPMQIDLL